MLAPLIARFFDRNATPVRVGLLAAVSAGYLVVLARPDELAGPVGWSLLLGAIAAAWFSPRFPLASALAQTGLLAVGEFLAADNMIPLKVLASFALFELAMRRSGWALPLGATALSAVSVLVGLTHATRTPVEVAFQASLVVGGPLLLGIYIRAANARAREAEARAAEQERLRRSEARVVRVAERTAIARELHDLVAHHVASIVLRVGVARHLLDGSDEPMRQVLDDVHDTGSSALADLRRLVAVLRDPEAHDTAGGDLVDPSELPVAVAAVVDRARQVGLHVDATVDPALAGLDTVRGLAVLRLVQEGLTNVAKHAGSAAHVWLTAELDGGHVRLEIADDGDGVPSDTGSAEHTGHGLTGMRERVALLGGTLRAGPEGTGWRLKVHLPVTEPDRTPSLP
ncbi:sensor histidine kinase [Prauserella cavernicola]|uniref:Oxygen sensor histidine kinase NreB n=1 Tax=Prauserella cavernicola TaxID=2800127 RepID=A0A934V4C3_9PSEU|nr:sensor histidine kinase [Prauserella cavernicola]MBK1788216.1 sensor histidine kinase [Prauserella cavernicola]